VKTKATPGSSKTASVALCGWEPDELKPVATILTEMGYSVHLAETIAELALLLKSEQIGAVLMHICPSRQEFLPILGRSDMPPVIPLLRHADKQMYMGLLRRGAFDCAALPPQKGELKRVLSLAIERQNEKNIAATNAA
jgi:DNA-binding NtrC family response regulator